MIISDTSSQIEKLVQIGTPTFESFYPSLYLDVKSPGKASWILRYQLHCKCSNYLKIRQKLKLR
jgi:hypothetical protein